MILLAGLAGILLFRAWAGEEGDALLDQAKKSWSEKKYEEAAEAYKKLRDNFPSHDFVRSGDAQFWLWCSLANAGRGKEEIQEIEKFLKEYPKHRSCPYALYFKGAALSRLGEGEKARQAWEELLEKHPSDPMARHAREALSGGGGAAKAAGRRAARTLGEDFIDFAEDAAKWLQSIAVEEGGGLAWPEYEEGKTRPLNFYSGSSGICLFFLNLYRITGKEEYATLARKSAQFLMNRRVKSGSGFCWKDEDENKDGSLREYTSPALYVGAAGIGYVFLCLHQEFGEPAYLDTARGTADWILSTGTGENGLCHWGEGTDIISGASGIGLFLLEIHKATGEKKYLECAARGAKWLILQGVDESGGLKWKSSLSLERFYTGFSHGTAGNAYFLGKVYECTKEKRCLDCGEAAARWLMHRATPAEQGIKWFHYEPGGEEKFQTGWCHGPAGTCRIFLALFGLTGKRTYLETAQKGASCLMGSLALGGKDNPFWGLSMCCGAAGVADFFLDLFLETGDEEYLEYAARIAEFLMDRAKPAGEGCRWTNSDQPDQKGKIYYGTGHMIGAAGIGSLFLKLHALCNNTECRFFPFADKPAGKPAGREDKKHSTVVLTNLPRTDPYFRAAEKLANAHGGSIVSFHPKRMVALRRRLQALAPRYVAAVLSPQDMDINIQRQMLALSTRMDSDPFCDFAFGWITGATAQHALSLVERSLRVQKEGLPKTEASGSVISGSKSYVYEGEKTPLQKELGWEEKNIYWACVESDPNVLAFVRDHIKELQHKGIVGLYGNGDPEGIWLFSGNRNMDRSKHWPHDPKKVGQDPKGEMPRITAGYFKNLDFGSAVVWSGTCHSGALHRVFVEGDIVSTFGTVDRITEYFIPEGRSLGGAILAAGPSAYLAPIGPNHGYACLPERYRAVSTGMPLGDVMRTRYNEIIFAAGGKLDIQLYEPGAPKLDEDPMRGGGVNRALFGDPQFKPFQGAKTNYLSEEISLLSGHKSGMQVRCEVVDEASGMFWDMFGDDREKPERIYTTIDLQEGLPSVQEVSARGKSPGGEEIALSSPAWAEERIDGKRVLHLQVNAARGSLQKRGTVVSFTLLFTKKEK